MKYFQLEFIFFCSLALSLGLTPLFALQARRLKIMDSPAHRKTHTQSVPYLGGLAIFASLFISFCLTTALRPNVSQWILNGGLAKAFFILAGTLGVAAVGLWDDMRDIRARYKLMGQIIFVALFVLFGFRFEVLHLPGLPPIQLSYLAIPLTIFWMLAIINAFNMVDGMDGLAVTVAAGSLVLLAAGTSFADNLTGLTLALGGLGAILGFLPYNWKPAKIYLGDAGSGGLGMFLACSLVALGQTYGQPSLNLDSKYYGQPFHYQILIATLLVAYPALEISLSVARRLLHGRSIVRGDQGHIHHRFLKIGFEPAWICLIALFVTLLPGEAALATIAKYHGWATWLMAIFGVILGFGLSTLGFLNFLKPKTVERFRPHFQIANYFISMQKVKLSIAATREDVLTLVNQACQELGVKSYRLIIPANENRMGGLDYNHDWDSIRDAANIHRDKISLKENRGGAEWVFTPPTGGEEELDMEYRVLISEFMREALQTAERLGENQATLELPSVAALPKEFVSGHALRKRRKTKLAIVKPFKSA